MSEINPYTPPETNPIPPPAPGGEQTLASPGIRLVAQIIDGIIIAVIMIPLSFFTGFFRRTMEAASQGVQFRLETLLWGAIGLVVYVAVNWVFLQKGQTIGKKAMKVRIVRKDGSPIAPQRIITHRLLPVQAAALVPWVGNFAVLIDALMIFRAGRNTLHDDIADTKVVQA